MQFFLLFPLLLSYAFGRVDFAPSGPELDLVLRHIGDFDLGLVGIEESGDEDVVYLHRRAEEGGEKCEDDDCAQFKAWAPEDGTDEDSQEEDPDDELDVDTIAARDLTNAILPLHRLVKRKPKPGTICKNTKIDSNPNVEDPIKFESYTYPGNKAVEKDQKKVYDFEEFDQPNTIEWFKIKNIEKRVAKRDYAVEHILEWQMLLRFLTGKKGRTNKESEARESDDDDDADAFCETLHMYWKQPIKFEVETGFKKEGRTWVPSTDETEFTNTALEYVGYQFPGIKSKSPFSGEFVILEKELNSKKEDLWAGSNLSPFLYTIGDDNKASPDNKQNYKTMQFNLEHNKWWDETQSKGSEPKDSTENEGRCKGIGKFRDVLGVYLYHQDPHVAGIFKAQVERVEQAFKTMEEDILPNQVFTDSNGKPRPPYASLGLADKWKTFMKEETDQRIEKIEEWMEKWAKKFEDLKKDGSVKDLGRIFQKRATYTNLCGTAVDDEVTDRIKLLLEAYDNRGKWTNNL